MIRIVIDLKQLYLVNNNNNNNNICKVPPGLDVQVAFKMATVTLQLVPAASGPPGQSMAIFVAMDGPPEPIMAATDGPPLLQVVPQYVSILYNF